MHQHVINPIANRGKHDPQRIRKEGNKSKSIARIAPYKRALPSRGRGDLALAVEAQVNPAGEEAEQGEEEGGVGAEQGAGEDVGEDEDGRKMLDAHFEGAAEERDGVFGHQLLERDEEGGFEGDEAVDWGGADSISLGGLSREGLGNVLRRRMARDGKPTEVHKEGQRIRNGGHKQAELAELLAAPRALEVASAIEDCQAASS